MYTGAETIEHVNAHRQELDRQIARTIREIEVERILNPSHRHREARPARLRVSGWLRGALASLGRGRERSQVPSG